MLGDIEGDRTLNDLTSRSETPQWPRAGSKGDGDMGAHTGVVLQPGGLREYMLGNGAERRSVYAASLTLPTHMHWVEGQWHE